MPIAHLEAWLAMSTLPALTNVESAIAKAWLVKHQNDYDTVEFNMRLGAGVKLPPGTPAYIVDAAKAGTTKRTDMVLRRGSDVTIVEVKKRINAGSMGQLQVYQQLFLADHPATGHIGLVAAGLTVQADIEPILRNAGISVELFPNAGA